MFASKHFVYHFENHKIKGESFVFFPTAEGYCDYKKDQYIYQYKDHLRNVRVSFGRNSAGALEITDANDYYPFGMNHLKTGNAFYGQGSYKNYKYNGKELQETGMYDYGARMYMADIGRWGVVDPLAEKYFNISPFNYTANNPILYIDPDGMQLDLSNIMKKGNEEQYKAFVFFAKTKEGQAFLSKYMEKGQKVEYGGKTIFEAKANGEYHNKGIDLSYGVKTDSSIGGSTKGKIKGDEKNVSILISNKAYGDSGSQFFNTLRQIVHESFVHADLEANDLQDDGYLNSSSIPKEYRKYDTWESQHGQHYYIQNEYLKDPTNNKVNTYTKEGFQILKQANEALKLKLGNSQIKTEMWNFNGSMIKVDKNGSLKHKDQ
ncbi:RHS repeat-associated core domain-containing protein [Chryseobacterium joostei]|uniref:RHS repeat-associated core domain-containing protein n=2 Tax=Chryseobacterium joostei TaxID=112234 RepID=A0ABN5SC49_9FLAO|nr:RHS repeat-associated core domain-containing protein [Chryseobacterium joostei]AZA99761.1 RHS repeat-associated core domain-containing protein [Chryseobacterium joostei]